MPMSRRALSIITLAVTLSLASAATSAASTGPARGGVGDAWGPVQVPARVASASTPPARGGVGDAWGPVYVPAKNVVHAGTRAHRMARARNHHHH